MQCDVTDLQGNHCPEVPEHTVMFDGVETHLCKRCFANVVAGAYGRHLTQRPASSGVQWRNQVMVANPTAANANSYKTPSYNIGCLFTKMYQGGE